MFVKSCAELVTGTQRATQMDPQHCQTIPIFINARDRLGCLSQLLDWLSGAGYSNIIIIDNASTYRRMAAFLQQCSYPVVRSRRNLGHTALWSIKGLQPIVRNHWFVYTDPDVVPIEKCPANVVSYLYELLDRHPDYVKAGIGLLLTDIPDHYHLKQSVIRWEENLYGQEIEPNVYEADIDTTFALYRPGTPYLNAPSLRTRGDYQGRHLAWYVDSGHIDDEEQYYRDHASGKITHWNTSGASVYDEELPPKGGATAAMMNEPLCFIEQLVHSISWTVVSPQRWLDYVSGRARRIDFDHERMTREQLRNEILRILRSQSWQSLQRLQRWRSRWEAWRRLFRRTAGRS